MNAYLALVGDRSPHVRSHARIPALLEQLRDHDHLDLDAYWVGTGEVDQTIGEFDGIWLLPGSPYRSEAGALRAVRAAREHRIPFLGTCGGFQHAMLEFACNVSGLSGVQHGETSPHAVDQLIVPLECSLDGHAGPVELVPGSRAATIVGATRTTERYHCSYGLDPGRLAALESRGLRFTGQDPETGAPRIAELPGHPFYLATLFQPELAPGQVHPLIAAFAEAVGAHALNRFSPRSAG